MKYTSEQLNRFRSLERKADKFLGKRKGKGKRKKKKLKYGKKVMPFVRPKYKEYIKSAAWKDRRKAYYALHKKECVVCKSNHRVGLHHLTYRNLGREKDEELVALCWSCHEGYHNQYGVKHDNDEDTQQYIIEEQQLEEFREIAKNL